MKIKCTHCGEDLSKVIRENFEQYEVGRVICPKCRCKQKRYISESELLMYFGVSALSYVVLFALVMAIFKVVGTTPFGFLLVALLFVIGYFLMKNVSLAIYKYAFFKKDLQNTIFKEDKVSIQKHLRWQFIMFMLVALMFGTNAEFSLYFLIAIGLFVVIVGIKIYLSIKNERKGLKERIKD